VIAIEPRRFVLETFSDGGLLLDLESEILFSLNATAAFIWAHALEGMRSKEVADRLVAKFDVHPSVAETDVAIVLTLTCAEAIAQHPADLQYETTSDGYRLSADGVPLMEIAPSGRALRALSECHPIDLGVHLRALAPKLVTLLGASVLHASAVMRTGAGIVAFLGPSGAGKTTTARAFVHDGWRPVSEDKLVLRLDGESVAVALGGEALIAAWIKETRDRLLVTGPQQWCDASALADVATGPERPISDVILLDGTRRAGAGIQLRRLSPFEAAGKIFHHGFYGSAKPEEWRRQIRLAAMIARTARTFAAVMPDGLDVLMAAAARYTEITAS
jgi:Coenzyme PQQ synthesis protein D (PqqD)